MRQSIQLLQSALSALVLLSGLAIAFSTLSRGIWLDEFYTHVTTARGVSPAQFLREMLQGEQLLLHYGMVYLAQAAGVTGFAELRSLNFFGVLLVLAALWQGKRRRALTSTQICIVVALYASSPIFLDYFAELRGYFLVLSAGIAVSVAWVIVLRAEAASERTEMRGDLVFYGVCLGIFVNLHYFATFMGGLMTLGILVDAGFRREWRKAIAASLVGLVAAAPALAFFVVQSTKMLAPSPTTWIYTGREGLLVAADVVSRASARNVVAAACAIVACLALAESWRRWKEAREILLLGAAIVMFYGLLVTLNLIMPLVADRYLFAGAGPVILLLSLLCSRPGMPVLTAAAVCVFALLTQANDVRRGEYQREGWRTSARYVAQQIERCPATPVFVTPRSRRELGRRTRAFGYEYYAREFHFSVRTAHPGDTVTVSGGCPSLIWFEHVYRSYNFPVDKLLDELRITAVGHAEVKYVGSGAVITVR